ncbi:IS66 family insertion sequence element accessory protein TnpA [Pseudoflavonifractor phocaeensis]|uniref:IS66 family insertion sequence element accessory protein TnpA n=1 Tax=Pseudoflavonifractor phocaeensis TaxID=1870988 RepID=UPI001F37D32A|nr:transposase [Pseudoflavonifractor phocaeensis]MCF2596955.1 IS66 family insertion sequence element accessory protein TnpB [Pseudoflavonifractor phocaeensis]
METGLQALNQQQRTELWAERIQACRSSGQTVQIWCRENGVSQASYYKWQRRIFNMAASGAPQFVEVATRPGTAPSAVLHIGEASVDIIPGMDEETLAMICQVLKSC